MPAWIAHEKLGARLPFHVVVECKRVVKLSAILQNQPRKDRLGLGVRTLEVRHQSFFQFQKSSILARITRVRFEFFDVPKQGFGIVCVEIKSDHVKSGDLEEGASAVESVTESFEFSFYEFVSRFSVGEFQWCATSESGFRLGQPCVGFFFVAKDPLGFVLD
jgi:hypothetical protein